LQERTLKFGVKSISLNIKLGVECVEEKMICESPNCNKPATKYFDGLRLCYFHFLLLKANEDLNLVQEDKINSGGCSNEK
jgi:hypothetical protein